MFSNKGRYHYLEEWWKVLIDLSLMLTEHLQHGHILLKTSFVPPLYHDEGYGKTSWRTHMDVIGHCRADFTLGLLVDEVSLTGYNDRMLR